MPSSLQNIWKKEQWKKSPYLKGFVLLLVLVIIISAVTLIVLIIVNKRKAICDTINCLEAAAKIKAQINAEIDPCVDFYAFACGNYVKETDDSKIIEPEPDLIQKQAEEEILQLYNNAILIDDHYSVKLSKRLFKACTNLTAIEVDNLDIIKNVLTEFSGGWPLLGGSEWNKTQFDWLRSTYKLREMGYYFSIFLDLNVRTHPRNPDKSILQLRIPFDLDEAADSLSHKRSVIKKVALAFGVDVNALSREMKKLYDFAEKISNQMLDHQGLSSYPIKTIKELQSSMPYIHWLEFINNITGPRAQVTADDDIILVEANSIRQRFDLLSKTPKRTQANYMIWKVIQQTLPYLSSVMQNLLSEGEYKEPRKLFCLKEIQTRFLVSPIDVVYARKHITIERKNKVEEIAKKMKEVFLKSLNNVKWLSDEDRYNIEDKARDLIIIIGEPGDYFSDDILNNALIDVKVSDDDDHFLNLLSQINRNYKSLIYSKIKKSNKNMIVLKKESFYLLYNMIYYYPEYNILRLPTANLQKQMFDENSPNYLNYAVLGKELGKEFTSLLKLSSSYFDKYGRRTLGWSQETTEKYGKVSGCLIKNMEHFKKVSFDFMLIEMQANIMGVKLAYDTYKEWTNVNGEEIGIIDVKYTPDQLFWISTVTCYPNNTDVYQLSSLPDTQDLPQNMVYSTMRNNFDFAKDFNCPSQSQMNPNDKCQFL